MHDIQGLPPQRSVCGGATRKRLEHPGMERLGAVVAKVYADNISPEQKRYLKRLYLKLIDADCAISNMGMSNADPLPNVCQVPFFKRPFKDIKTLAETVETIAQRRGLTPPQALIAPVVH